MVTASIRTLSAEVDVLDVPSAEEALFISTSLPLDLVVLDFRLPGMSGLELVTRLRKRKPETPIILVTGVEDAGTRQLVAEAGVAAYFFKPIEIDTFLDAVRHCLWPDQSGIGLPVARPSPNKVTSVSKAPGDSEAPAKSEVPGVSKARGESGAPGASGTPGKSELPGASGRPGKSGAPGASGVPGVSGDATLRVTKPMDLQGFQPTLVERLTALKQQVRAESAILVNENGQISEEAGSVAEIAANPALLPALMDTFRLNLKVSDALGKGLIDSLFYFMVGRQRIYLAPVDPSNLLLVITMGHLEPDKLGMLDRAIHLAVHDLRDILERLAEAHSHKPGVEDVGQVELPAEIDVDQETLALVDHMFSQAPKNGSTEDADGFWETLGENDALDGTPSRGSLSYDQARDMGLALDEDKGPEASE